MTSLPPPMCYFCVHLHDGEDMTCDAFPDGIPQPILESVADHRNSYSGDNGVVWEQDPATPPLDFSQYVFTVTDEAEPYAVAQAEPAEGEATV